jgi:chromosome partitioning protein
MQAATPRTGLSGSLEELSLANLLQALPRDYLRVDLFSREKNQLGAVAILNDMVLSVQAGNMRGASALRRLCALERGFYDVTLLESNPPGATPLGTIGQVLFAALSADTPARSRKADQVTKAMRPSSLHRARQRSRTPAPRPISVAIASPKGGVGKTTIALNLGQALATSGWRVLLIDGTINGDVLAALHNQNRRRAGGVLEIFHGNALLDHMVLATAAPNLQLLPAFGRAMRVPELAQNPGAERWRDLLGQLGSRADVVLIDTDAGLFGHTQAILSAATYVLGILQAEPLSARLADRFHAVLPSLAGPARAGLLGLVMNMVMQNSPGSVEAVDAVAARYPGELFRTRIPRTASVLDASRAGLPLPMADAGLAGIFMDVASELCARVNNPPDFADRRTF